jgi:serine/threonine protein kinase
MTTLATRYEILAPLATGDFATVYRGRDRELARDVAIKQIHPQFLSDPRQLEMYWQEAQLLASLEHPHIMTIYDIVRSRGWLILELMQGNLKQAAKGQPLDLNFLRQALAATLQALSFLHQKGVIHGDVKPTNLFLDRRGQVKLGDFGLARRATSDQGSLLKGTTRYMAPELIAQQFGPIGPHSDLYSLGFSFYELMCGDQFESLFPGMEAFGRDKQVAWMMWHAAPDRRLPEVSRVLEGVPPDLAHVIQRLTNKDPAQRYRTAEQALADLHEVPTGTLSPTKEDEAAAEASKKAARRKRIMAIGALAVSLIMSLGLLFFPGKEEEPPPTPLADPVAGVIRSIDPNRRILIVEMIATGDPKELRTRPEDPILLNDKRALLQELKESDRVTIRELTDENGRRVLEIIASRPRTSQGRIKMIRGDEGRFLLALDGDGTQSDLELAAGPSAKMQLNKQSTFEGKPVTLATLKEGDRVAVEHYQDGLEHWVIGLSAVRTVSLEGVIREIDLAGKRITVASSGDQNATLVTYPLADKVEISLNQRRFIEGRSLVPDDLKPGDRVTVEHDTHISRVDAMRLLVESGIVRRIQFDVKSLDVALSGKDQPVTFFLDPSCKIKLASAEAPFDDLRQGDQIAISHQTAAGETPAALFVEATRPVDKEKWLVVIGNETYDDGTLTRPGFAAGDVDLVKRTMAERYGVSPDQTLALVNESRIRIEQALPAFLAKISSARQLVVYYAGHAFTNDENVVHLAPRDFALSRIDVTGIKLKWLVDLLENCPADEKLLVLDATHTVTSEQAQRQPSSAEMIATIVGTKSAPGLKTVTALASCSAGERGAALKTQSHGGLAWFVAEGFGGKADRERNVHVGAAEIFEFVKAGLAGASGELGAPQTPALFLPDNTPPRLADEAKQILRRIAADLTRPQVDAAKDAQLYSQVAAIAAKEPEPKLMHAIMLWRAADPKDASQVTAAKEFVDELKATLTAESLPWKLSAWQNLEQQAYPAAVADLAQMVARLKAPRKPGEPWPEPTLKSLEWCGTLRDYAAQAVTERRRASAAALSALDGAVANLGAEAVKAYEAGRAAAQQVMKNFDKQIADEATPDPKRFALRQERIKLHNYAAFPLDTEVQQLVNRLDQ